MKPSLQFYIDVSGQPKKDIYIGLISVQGFDMTNILKNVKRKFPWFFHRRSKGSSLDFNQLKSIISLLNGIGVKMICLHFKGKEWDTLINYCGKDRPFNFERIFAALYFSTLKKFSKENNIYPVTVCVETFMNIDKTISYLKKIANAHKIDYQISKTQVKYNEMLKLSDAVAAFGRKYTNPEKLGYESFKLIGVDTDILKYYLNVIKK
ncbi:hypothetical protein M0R19_02605 [Candidatus Pacearchaeota archaeon]|jgi:hypothetical protein|nr:hypothetical protein [Candidatus Pacearchaeota archaeon]